MTEYKIIKGTIEITWVTGFKQDPSIVEKINEAITEGWLPIGGVAVDTFGNLY